MKKILFILPVLALLSSCGTIPQADMNIFCMDTVMNMQVYGDNCEKAVSESETELRRLERLFDRGDEKSDVYAVNNGGADISDDTAEIVKAAIEASRETDGAFDITVLPVMDLWGFYDRQYNVPSDESIKNVLRSVDYRNVFFNNGTITLLNNAKIDLGGIGKGYATDKVRGILKENGINSAMINLGGNVYAVGEKPSGGKWRVGVADPYNSGEPILTMEVSDAAVVTSGSYERNFERDGKVYHHIIDPKTGTPVNNGIKSVTVVCESGTKADALSTALFVMGREKTEDFLTNHSDIGAVIITEDKKVYCTDSLFDNISVNGGIEKEEIAVSKY